MGGADFKATLTVDLQFLPEKIHRLMRLTTSQRAMAHSVIQVLLVHQTMQVIPELYCIIQETSNLPHVSTRYPIHTSLLSVDHTGILRPPNNSDAQGNYLTDDVFTHRPI